ncbi:hypothetical protein GCM10022212_35090 [Actimicrobium antarcticum]|uniref:Uncharacterized protein n=1 Tax=Actimicrobium antarcticum TaxID=1051899 RepID=A0ABP7TY37_9BURK
MTSKPLQKGKKNLPLGQAVAEGTPDSRSVSFTLLSNEGIDKKIAYLKVALSSETNFSEIVKDETFEKIWAKCPSNLEADSKVLPNELELSICARILDALIDHDKKDTVNTVRHHLDEKDVYGLVEHSIMNCREKINSLPADEKKIEEEKFYKIDYVELVRNAANIDGDKRFIDGKYAAIEMKFLQSPASSETPPANRAENKENAEINELLKLKKEIPWRQKLIYKDASQKFNQYLKQLIAEVRVDPTILKKVNSENFQAYVDFRGNFKSKRKAEYRKHSEDRFAWIVGEFSKAELVKTGADTGTAVPAVPATVGSDASVDDATEAAAAAKSLVATAFANVVAGSLSVVASVQALAQPEGPTAVGPKSPSAAQSAMPPAAPESSSLSNIGSESRTGIFRNNQSQRPSPVTGSGVEHDRSQQFEQSDKDDIESVESYSSENTDLGLNESPNSQRFSHEWDLDDVNAAVQEPGVESPVSDVGNCQDFQADESTVNQAGTSRLPLESSKLKLIHETIADIYETLWNYSQLTQNLLLDLKNGPREPIHLEFEKALIRDQMDVKNNETTLKNRASPTSDSDLSNRLTALYNNKSAVQQAQMRAEIIAQALNVQPAVGEPSSTTTLTKIAESPTLTSQATLDDSPRGSQDSPVSKKSALPSNIDDGEKNPENQRDSTNQSKITKYFSVTDKPDTSISRKYSLESQTSVLRDDSLFMDNVQMQTGTPSPQADDAGPVLPELIDSSPSQGRHIPEKVVLPPDSSLESLIKESETIGNMLDECMVHIKNLRLSLPDDLSSQLDQNKQNQIKTLDALINKLTDDKTIADSFQSLTQKMSDSAVLEGQGRLLLLKNTVILANIQAEMIVFDMNKKALTVLPSAQALSMPQIPRNFSKLLESGSPLHGDVAVTTLNELNQSLRNVRTTQDALEAALEAQKMSEMALNAEKEIVENIIGSNYLNDKSAEVKVEENQLIGEINLSTDKVNENFNILTSLPEKFLELDPEYAAEIERFESESRIHKSVQLNNYSVQDLKRLRQKMIADEARLKQVVNKEVLFPTSAADYMKAKSDRK